MKRFIINTLGFLGILLLLLGMSLLLPPTPHQSKSLLFASVKKDSLLANVPQPRIIFIGGSNLTFGLNSQTIKDSLNINPINTAIHANLGLRFVFESSYRYIRKGDIIVVVPEYSHFYQDYNKGSEELLRTVLDVDKSNIKFLNFKQMINCAQYIRNFVFSRFKKYEYTTTTVTDSDVYGVNSFNQYGDACVHWNMDRQKFYPSDTLRLKSYNPKVMEGLKEFEEKIRQKGAILYVSYPCFQDSSFYKSKAAIKKVEEEYAKYGFLILGTPNRYMMNDSLMFNTYYHLNKKGVDYRTQLLVEDLKKALPPVKRSESDSLKTSNQQLP